MMLWENHEKIEDKLSESAREIFSLKETIILYDLTNTYFEGTMKNSKIASPGKSKERRNDRPLITLALTLDGNGFPKRSRVLKGNVSEPETFKKILDELSNGFDGIDLPKTIVMDAGIATEDNLALAKSKNFKFVAVSRKKTYADDFWKDCEEKKLNLAPFGRAFTLRLRRTPSFHCCSSGSPELACIPHNTDFQTEPSQSRHR
jgi:transposase